MKRKELVFAMAFAATLALVGTGTAAAGDPQQPPADPTYVNTGGGAHGGPVVRTAAEQALYDQKVKLADEYAAVRAGTLDYATFKADDDAFLAKAGAASSLSIVVPMYTELTLPLEQIPQAKSYYCGPATAVEILRSIEWIYGPITGPNGESLNQNHVAGPCEVGYLCTNYLGETPWYYYSGYPHPMKSTLNQWAGTSYYVVENDTSGWVNDMQYDIIHYYPIASNTYERADGTGYYLVGHPHNRSIGHWVAVHGFKNSGSTTRYADSVHGTDFGWGWEQNVPAHSDISSARFEWLMSNNSKGYVW